MQKMNKFITIHGIDGTGKTSATVKICELLKGQLIECVNYDKSPMREKNPFYAAKKRMLLEGTIEQQFCHYLGSTLYHSNIVSRLLQEGKVVVKSRYIDDVLAHHDHAGVENTEKIASLLPIKQPDLKILLTVQEEAREKRIQKRGIEGEEDRQSKEP